MTRVSNDLEINNRQALVKELKKKIGRPKTIRRGGCLTFGNCCLGSLLIVLFLLLGGTILIAKTGLVEIPLFTDYFYEPLKPSRAVTLSKSFNTERLLADKLDDQLFNNLKTGMISGQSVTLTFNEQELTGIFQTLLIDDPSQPSDQEDNFVLRDVQVAILENELEIFGNLEKPVTAQLLITVKPTFENQRLGLEITHVKLGQAPIPGFILTRLIGGFLNSQVQELATELNKRATLTEFSVNNHELRLAGVLK